MKILGIPLLVDYSNRHPTSRAAIAKWKKRVEAAQWKNHAELKEMFPSADYIPSQKFYVFNIGGNKTRLCAVVSFNAGMALVEWIGTHAEYSKKNFN